MYTDRFMIDRGSIQGDIPSPPSFTVALDRIFRRHDTRCEGIGGPPLKIPRVGKLEYADDGSLVNKNTDGLRRVVQRRLVSRSL